MTSQTQYHRQAFQNVSFFNTKDNLTLKEWKFQEIFNWFEKGFFLNWFSVRHERYTEDKIYVMLSAYYLFTNIATHQLQKRCIRIQVTTRVSFQFYIFKIVFLSRILGRHANTKYPDVMLMTINPYITYMFSYNMLTM